MKATPRLLPPETEVGLAPSVSRSPAYETPSVIGNHHPAGRCNALGAPGDDVNVQANERTEANRGSIRLKQFFSSSPAGAGNLRTMRSLFTTHSVRADRRSRSRLRNRSRGAMLSNTRSRPGELYFNSSCLVRAACSGRFDKIPFFLRHIWCALAE